MAKRQRSSHLSSSSVQVVNSDYEESSHSDDDYVPTTNSARKKSTARTNTRKRQKIQSSKDTSELDSILNSRPHTHSSHVVSSGQRTAIQNSLIAWFGKVRDKRGMPWRKRFDPSLDSVGRSQRAYEVWVSEIMLQQTQVATVIPYYNRWMSEFPTVRELASASVDEVNALWKGLGYYSRASRLLQGAQKIVNEMNGRLPDNAKALESSIPGIGRYSAGAISSIAYGESAPVLDGNVHRLLSRFLALHSPPKSKSTLDILWTAATVLVEVSSPERTESPPLNPPSLGQKEPSPQDRINLPEKTTFNPGDINQALIELGSTICKVHDPQCSICPLKTWCATGSKGTSGVVSNTQTLDIEDLCTICEPLSEGWGPTSFPMKVQRKKAREEIDLVYVVEWNSSISSERVFLLSRRPETGLLAGLYEFPSVANVSTKPSKKDASSHLHSALASFIDVSPPGQNPKDPRLPRVEKIQLAGTVKHLFSHIKKDYCVVWVILTGDTDLPPALKAGADPVLPPTASNKKTKKKLVNSNNTIGSGANAVWLGLGEVEHANVGTGMLKVWQMAQTLWSSDS